MSGVKDGLVWWWDLNAADATITDQHNGLVLTRVGTTTTVAGGAPDGGDCVSVGVAAGKYRNASVAKTVPYERGFSVNVWAFVTAASSFGNWLVNHRNDPSAPPDNRYFQLATQEPTVGDFVSVNDAANVTNRLASTGLPASALNQWVMLTAVDNGTQTSIYRNGVLLGTSSTSLGTRATGPAAFALGGDSWVPTINAGTQHRGRISMAGVWDRPLTADEITWLFNSGSGRRYNALTYGERDLGGEVLWICPSLDDIGAGTLVARDLTTNRNHGILTGMDVGDWVVDTANGGLRALDFDGVNDEVRTQAPVISTAYCVSVWVKPTVGAQGGLVDLSANINNLGAGLYLNANGTVVFYCPSANDGSARSFFTTTNSVTSGQWVHLVGRWQAGSINDVWINGVQAAGTLTGTIQSSLTTRTVLSLGSRQGLNSWLTGQLDDVRCFTRLLTQTEITALASQRGYQRPAVNGIGGELAWWCPSLDTFGNGTLLARDLANQRYHGTLNNMSAATDWPNDTVSGGVRAVDLNTTTAMINNPGFAATNQFPLSISVWIFQRQISPIARWVTLTNNETFVIRQSNGDRIHGYYIDANNQLIQLFGPFGSVVLNQWTHVALTHDGSTLRIYRNGTQIASSAVSTKTRQTLGLIFGSNWGERFDGRMDDMRIFNRALTASEVAVLASQRGYNLPSNTRRRRYAGAYGL